MINWERKSITIEGVEYSIGTAGSLILACDVCGMERFRERFTSRETCWTCGPQKLLQLIRIDELETKWKPLWRSLGLTVKGDPCPKCGEPWSHEHDSASHLNGDEQ
jgi:hypothetical protein